MAKYLTRKEILECLYIPAINKKNISFNKYN